MKKKLRSGYTTGACAAAAAKGAAVALLTGGRIARVGITFPDGSVVRFDLHRCDPGESYARASVIKDGGDDPDVTHGAEIVAEVRRVDDAGDDAVTIVGGAGVGKVTKPGLAVAVGGWAINPVPTRMITAAVQEAAAESGAGRGQGGWEVKIIVPAGEELATKTLNSRLGIIGGISILGTTGIVRPISADAWTDTIRTALDVAEANGVEDVILSTGRTSERCVEKLLNPPEEALVMMGDHLHFALQEVHRHLFRRVHVATMWAKLLKGAMGHAQTHVRHGALDTGNVCGFLRANNIDAAIVDALEGANTAREIFERLTSNRADSVIDFVCDFAKNSYRNIAGVPVVIHLVDGNGTLVCSR